MKKVKLMTGKLPVFAQKEAMPLNSGSWLTHFYAPFLKFDIALLLIPITQHLSCQQYFHNNQRFPLVLYSNQWLTLRISYLVEGTFNKKKAQEGPNIVNTFVACSTDHVVDILPVVEGDELEGGEHGPQQVVETREAEVGILADTVETNEAVGTRSEF